jgi:carbon-monoxide dehydrogenase small subunit
MIEAAAKVEVHCTVNGARQTLRVHPLARLLDVLREDLGLTGTKEGCGEGECGACSVLVDAEIKTIEGVSAGGAELHAVQQAFIECGGAQCGICTPGMVLAAVSLLAQIPQPTDADIRNGLAGNLCRCTGYMKIFDAVVRACERAGVKA